MEGLVVFSVVVGALALLVFLAGTFGVDSRDGTSDPRSPERGLTL
jgi:hypothetical protein